MECLAARILAMRKLFMVCLFSVVAGFIGAQGQMSLASPNQDDAKLLAKTEKEYIAAKAGYHHRSSAKSKQAYVIATVKYGTVSMVATTLPPKTKYRQALRLYREALKLDPTNHEAKSNSDLIISIYRSMHRPVPN